jgi:hypothetical protein
MIKLGRTRGTAALLGAAVLAMGVGAPSALAATGTTAKSQTATAKAKKAKDLAPKAAQAKRASALAKQRAAARYIGVTHRQLATALGSGQSLAEVAEDNGKTATGLVRAILASAKTFLATAVADGDITQAQSDAILAGLTRSVTAQVNGAASPRLAPTRAGLRRGPDLLAAAATYIGVSRADLLTALEDGSSLADVATDKGKTTEGLIQAVVAAAKADLDQAVTDGKLTQARADAMLTGITARITEQVEQAGLPHPPGPPPMGPGHGPGGQPDVLAAAATYIGVSQTDLRTALQDGSSLADVAKDHGKTVDGLIAAMVAAAKSGIAQAVTDGHLTQAQADQIIAGLTERITEHVNRAGGDCGPGARMGGPGGGPAGFGGPGGSDDTVSIGL